MPIIKKTPISNLKETEGQVSLDVFQTEDKIVVLAPVAGVDPNDISISITDDVLTIRGERKFENEVNEENYFSRECYWGSFSRSIILPSNADASKISATFAKNHILRIEIPKTENISTKTIRIKHEE